MAKITLTDMTSGYQSTAVYNGNNTALRDALENTVSRDGTSPNTMSTNLDLNSNKVVNLADATNNQDAVTLSQLNAAGVVVSTVAATGVTVADAGGYYVATTAEGALQEVFTKLADTANGEGASLIGIEDSGALITATTVEAALAELATSIAAFGTPIDNIVEDTTPQLGGALDVNSNAINCAGNDITDPRLVNYTLPVETGSISSGVCTIDMDDGNVVEVTLTENITSWTLTNKPTAGYFELLIKFVQDGTGSRTVAWGGDLATLDWPGGTAPTITTTLTTGTDIVSIKCFDASGTAYFGNVSQDYQ